MDSLINIIHIIFVRCFKTVNYYLVNHQEVKNKLASDFQQCSPLWRWSWGFSPYSTGRVLRFANCAKLKIEVRDRTLARTGPHSDCIAENRRRPP